MGNNINDFRGLSPEDMSKANDDTKNKSGDGEDQNKQTSQQTSKEQQKSKESQDSENKQSQQASNDDGDKDHEKERKLLVNTFGYSEDEIDEKAINVAKSYLKSQSGYTKKAQEASEAEKANEALANLNTFFQKNPDIYKKVQSRLSGEENSQQEPEGKPNLKSTERKLDKVTERELVQEGYLSDGDLEGLDELQRAEKLIDAKTQYLTDQRLSQFEQSLQQKEQNFEQQRQQKRIKTENETRLEDGFERLVVEHGVDFEEVPDNIMTRIRKRAAAIKDPEDQRLIDKDAYYDAGLKELVSGGYVKLDNRFGIKSQNEKEQGLEDTGTEIGSNSKQPSKDKKSVGQLLNESNKQRWNQVIDRTSRFQKFKQKAQ